MITEIIASSAIYALYRNWDKIKLTKKWQQINYSKSSFTNRLGKSLYLRKIERTEYGHVLTVELPYGYTNGQLIADLDIFKEGLGYKSVQIKSNGNIVKMHCIKNLKFKKYIPLKLPPNKLLIGDGLTNNLTVDMNKFPHMLIGGSTGTGKSRLLLAMLTNLINNCDNVDIHLLQIRKNDLGVFENCRQVKSNSKTLDEILESLEKIDKECYKREDLIDNTKGYYNIADYNKEAYYKLKYIYVVIEEFSFLNIARGDTKEDKQLKNECLKHVKSIVNVGRSSGIFLITALQKPTSDSIPSDIKAQLTTRVALRIADTPASIVILGDGSATKLQEREIIVKTLDVEQGYTFTFGHTDVVANTNDKVVVKATKPTPNTSKMDILDILNEINK